MAARGKRGSSVPGDERRRALEEELLRAQQKPIVEASAWYLSIYAIMTFAIVLIAGVALLIVLVS
jgi:hypothetical protein